MPAPIRVRQIDHVTLVVTDLERSRRFYVDVLGMTPVARPAFPFDGLWFQAGSTQIHLIREHADSGPADVFVPGECKISRTRHFAFEVDDALAARDRLLELGLTLADGPKHAPTGRRRSTCSTPIATWWSCSRRSGCDGCSGPRGLVCGRRSRIPIGSTGRASPGSARFHTSWLADTMTSSRSHPAQACRTSGPMSDNSRKMIYGSIAAAGAVALASITDLIIGIPFDWGAGKTLVMDILFLISAGIVIYLGWDALKDLR